MTAASNSESRKRRTVAADPVEIVARTLGEHRFDMSNVEILRDEPGPGNYLMGCACGVQYRPSATGEFEGAHKSAVVVAALRAAGLLTPP